MAKNNTVIVRVRKSFKKFLDDIYPMGSFPEKTSTLQKKVEELIYGYKKK